MPPQPLCQQAVPYESAQHHEKGSQLAASPTWRLQVSQQLGFPLSSQCQQSESTRRTWIAPDSPHISTADKFDTFSAWQMLSSCTTHVVLQTRIQSVLVLLSALCSHYTCIGRQHDSEGLRWCFDASIGSSPGCCTAFLRKQQYPTVTLREMQRQNPTPSTTCICCRAHRSSGLRTLLSHCFEKRRVIRRLRQRRRSLKGIRMTS
jgi:hypothetical protein